MIKYRPNLDSLLWSMKCQEYFETIDDLKAAIAVQRTQFFRFIGKDEAFGPEDVQLRRDTDLLFGWKDFRNVILDGQIIGFCGE